MIKTMIEWLLSFFKEKKSKEQIWLEEKVKKNEEKLEEIENEENTPSDNVDYLNK